MGSSLTKLQDQEKIKASFKHSLSEVEISFSQYPELCHHNYKLLLYKLECFREISTTEKNRNWYM